jgi:hypothetical protein
VSSAPRLSLRAPLLVRAFLEGGDAAESSRLRAAFRRYAPHDGIVFDVSAHAPEALWTFFAELRLD